MNDSVSNSFNILKSVENAELLVKESIHDCSDTYRMILDRHFLDEFLLSSRLMLETTCFHSDSLDKTLGDEIIDFIILHIKKLILK